MLEAKWVAADQAYKAHHQTCRSCIAAGASPGRMHRCALGVQLWTAYQEAGDPPHFLWLQRKPPAVSKKYPPVEQLERWACAGGCGAFQLVGNSKVDSSCDVFVCSRSGPCAGNVLGSNSGRSGAWVRQACGEFFGARFDAAPVGDATPPGADRAESTMG